MKELQVFPLCLCVFVYLCSPWQVRGQPASAPYVWKNVKVVAGGFIPGIVFSRVEKGLAYCRTDIGGCYRWDDAAKKWVPLTDFLGESNYFGGESVAPDPVDANTVYIAGGMYSGEKAAMLRSRDRGKTWDVFPVSFRMGGNEDGRGVGERLAVDPNDTRVLLFGSGHEGLCRGDDSAQSWRRVESFPLPGLGNPQRGQRTHGGLSFVVFDPKSAAVFVGSVDPGEQHLFRSDDRGQTWKPVAGEQKKEFLPAKAEIDDAGILYITYGNGIGPNGVTDGGVFKLDTKTGEWTDISPDKRPDRPKGGYFGLSLDRSKPGTLAVATMNRWGPIDTVWRSTDGGKTWRDIVAKSERDVSLSPYLFWGEEKPKLGWWMSALALDPFDSDHIAYATGATIYASRDFSRVSSDEPTHWSVWADGIEETAVITLTSPTEGAHLLSGFGDIGGFVHDNFDVSPPNGMYRNPLFGNTNQIDYAGQKPSIVVRSGRPNANQAPLGWSEDGGHSWQPISLPESAGPAARRPTPAIVVSADGSTFMLMTRTPVISRDRGQTWTAISGLPEAARPIPDRVDPQKFYALDFNTAKFYTSNDGGATFVQAESAGLPADIKADAQTWHEAPFPLSASFDKPGQLWFVSHAGLFRSTDAGRSFAKIESDVHVDALSFGKAPVGSEVPALFAIGTCNAAKAIWRSDDSGKSWIRINDDQHQYGTRFRCIAGDPRVFGRVYVGTDGRGILYADPK